MIFFLKKRKKKKKYNYYYSLFGTVHVGKTHGFFMKETTKKSELKSAVNLTKGKIPLIFFFISFCVNCFISSLMLREKRK